MENIVQLNVDKYTPDGKLNPVFFEEMYKSVESILNKSREESPLYSKKCPFCNIGGVIMKTKDCKFYCECNCLEVDFSKIVRETEFDALVAWYINWTIREDKFKNKSQGELL